MTGGTLITFEEFERVDFGADDVELLNGVLIRMPPPRSQSHDICERLFKKLDAAVEGLQARDPMRRLGRARIERGYRFDTQPTSWLRPDVSLTHPDQPVAAFELGAPMIAFEIVSDSDTATDLDETVSTYLANGGMEVWLIYPNKAPRMGL